MYTRNKKRKPRINNFIIISLSGPFLCISFQYQFPVLQYVKTASYTSKLPTIFVIFITHTSFSQKHLGIFIIQLKPESPMPSYNDYCYTEILSTYYVTTMLWFWIWVTFNSEHLMEHKVSLLFLKQPPLDSILSQIYHILTFKHYFSKLFFHLCLGLPSGPFRFFDQYISLQVFWSIYISFLFARMNVQTIWHSK
jgi:hypothetical protein